MKKTILLALLLFAPALFAQSYNANVGGISYSSGPSVPGSCSPEGSFFFKNVATTGWYQCSGGAWAAVAGGGTGLPAGGTTPTGVPQFVTETPSGGVQGTAAWALSGVVPRASTCGSNVDTILVTDRAGYVTESDASACAVTLPQAGTAGFANNFNYVTCDIGAGTSTITPTTSTISYTTGVAYTSGASSLALKTGQCAAIYSNNTNYFAIPFFIPTVHTLTFSFGTPGGSALSTGILGYMTVPIACTITGWDIAVDAGTATVKTLKVAAGTAIPTLGSNSISTNGVAISSGTVVQSTTVTDFTTLAIAAHDIVAADMITTSGVGYIDFQLEVSCAQ